jgi:hypothetical protein
VARVLALVAGFVAAGPGGAPSGAPPAATLMAPPRSSAFTRVVVEVRPFVGLTGNGGGGAISDLAIEHYFPGPLKIWAELAPVAVGIDRFDSGAVIHGRLGAAYVADMVEVGLSAGGRLQGLGTDGYSIATHLRLGALDGLRLSVSYGYLIARNDSTGQIGASFSNVRVKLGVPVNRRTRLFADGAFSYDVWLYAIVGLEQALGGDLTRAPWRLSAGFGPAWIIDRFGCRNRYPSPCVGSAFAVGPTIGVGVERRF